MTISSVLPLTDLTVPRKQRAAVFEEWGKPINFIERPVVQESELEPGQVLVKIIGDKMDWLELPFVRSLHSSYAAHVTPIPESVPLYLAAPILCAGVTVYKAIKQTDTLPGDILVIPGAGGGLGKYTPLAYKYAINGFGLRVIAVDTGDNKKDLCLKLGAETFIDFKKSSNLIEDVMGAADGVGVHAAIVTSGSAAGYKQALEYLRPGGTLVAVGAPSGAKLELDIVESIPRNITVKISYVGNREDARQALDMVARGCVQTTCRVEPLAKLPDVFEEMEAGKLAGRVVLDLVDS
ncbi:unnamed protein product [Rhizoctonia solani]|uniref:Alcohol dehydrogenase-like C-terminal domain-containing protein n=1 Tax=Rhizoctonia solani TaxID=456999 RepID=A0A8H3BU12_9AGAM|nr:unnamed protein product [Rhizoctonia solani]